MFTNPEKSFRIIQLKEFVSDMLLSIIMFIGVQNLVFRPLPVEVILDKARRALSQEGYNLVYSNCEHFATECRYGQANSRQVRKIYS